MPAGGAPSPLCGSRFPRRREPRCCGSMPMECGGLRGTRPARALPGGRIGRQGAVRTDVGANPRKGHNAHATCMLGFAAMDIAADIPPRAGARELGHLPGGGSKPVIGETLRTLRDPIGLMMENHREFGQVYKINAFMQWSVRLLGPDALEYVLMDRDRNFSSLAGWSHMLGRFFSGGLLLRDFDDHRAHRRIMQVAFKPGAMKDYMHRMNGGIAATLDAWDKEPEFRFYTAVKQLTLDLGASVFLGMDIGPEARRINRAFIDELAGSVAIIRRPVPGLATAKGVRARKVLSEFFADLIPQRRGGDGADMFSQLCRASAEEGEPLTDREIVDHMNLMLMAAHDTTTSSATTMTWALAAHPEWQERIREQVLGIGGERLEYADLGRMDIAHRVFNEALRLVPPVPFIPRRAMRDFEFGGHRVPGGATVTISPGFVHLMPELWTDPGKFDPDRFGPDRAEDQRHRFAFAPFGGGAHKCIGMHFAYMQVKAFAFQFLRRFRVSIAPGYVPKWRILPIPRPLDNLPVTIERL